MVELEALGEAIAELEARIRQVAAEETDVSLAPTQERLDTVGIEIDADSAAPDWNGERIDLAWALDVLHPAASGRSRGDAPGPGRDEMDVM